MFVFLTFNYFCLSSVILVSLSVTDSRLDEIYSLSDTTVVLCNKTVCGFDVNHHLHLHVPADIFN